MILRRDLVEKVGGYDLGYTGTSEWCEPDLAKRTEELGYYLGFNSRVRVKHEVSRGGVFRRRTNSKERMENFLKFYFRHIFKMRFDYVARFGAYLLFMGLYWCYKAWQERNLDWLGGVWGTLTGLRFIWVKKER